MNQANAGLAALEATDINQALGTGIADSRLQALGVESNHKLLVLERSPGDDKGGIVASMHRLDLSNCGGAKRACHAELLTLLPQGPNNFRGMAQVAPGRIMLISDNGGKQPMQTVSVLIQEH